MRCFRQLDHVKSAEGRSALPSDDATFPDRAYQHLGVRPRIKEHQQMNALGRLRLKSREDVDTGGLRGCSERPRRVHGVVIGEPDRLDLIRDARLDDRAIVFGGRSELRDRARLFDVGV